MPEDLIHVSDIPCGEVLDQGAYEYCVKYLEKNFGHNNVAAYCMANEKQKVPTTNPYCHAQWYTGGSSYKTKGWLVATAFNKPSDSIVEEYLNFFVKESIFSRFILNRDDESCNKKGIILDASNPKGLVQMMNIICRTPREHTSCPHLWKIMVDNGVNPNSALFMAWSFNDIIKFERVYSYVRGHSWGTVSALSLGELNTLGNGFMSKSCLAHAPSSIVNSRMGFSGKTIVTLLAEGLAKAKKKREDKSFTASTPVVLDPFKPAVYKSGESNLERYLTVDEFIEFVIPEIVKSQSIIKKKEKKNDRKAA